VGFGVGRPTSTSSLLDSDPRSVVQAAPAAQRSPPHGSLRPHCDWCATVRCALSAPARRNACSSAAPAAGGGSVAGHAGLQSDQPEGTRGHAGLQSDQPEGAAFDSGALCLLLRSKNPVWTQMHPGPGPRSVGRAPGPPVTAAHGPAQPACTRALLQSRDRGRARRRSPALAQSQPVATRSARHTSRILSREQIGARRREARREVLVEQELHRAGTDTMRRSGHGEQAWLRPTSCLVLDRGPVAWDRRGESRRPTVPGAARQLARAAAPPNVRLAAAPPRGPRICDGAAAQADTRRFVQGPGASTAAHGLSRTRTTSGDTR
jgi:hypothetical protein